MGSYHRKDRIEFLNSIGYRTWFGELTSYHYVEICNLAEKHGMEIIAIIDNGVVFRYIK